MALNELVSEETLDAFERITKYDIRKYFESFVEFAQEGALYIYDYYSGELTIYPSNSFDDLNRLKLRSSQLIEMFVLNSSSFDTYEYWTLMELVEDSKSKLDTISNYSRWLRSPIKEGLYGKGVEVDYVVTEGQTLENVSDDIQGSEDAQNEWVDLALRNQLIEEDYTPDGGTILKIKSNNGQSLFLNSVVDNIDTVDKTFGLDIDRVITYEDNDLKVLTYRDTIHQAADILAGLKQGDNPFHPLDGRDEKGLLGVNYASISYPIISRQLITTFAKDDTFSTINISDIRREQDGVYFEYTIETKGGEVLRKGILIQ
jgi:hypothetical protein